MKNACRLPHLIGALAATLAGAAASAASPAPDHPIIGLWRVRVPGTACFEEYRFQPNGKVRVASAAEVAVSGFEISARPDDAGFYRLVDTIEQDNGKPDCGGQVTPVGDVIKLWVRFAADGNRFVACEDESLDRCVGPFERVLGQSS